jgi:lipopolysaccharide/colanic/teichoic acid biosynthesis glycosyltransferase
MSNRAFPRTTQKRIFALCFSLIALVLIVWLATGLLSGSSEIYLFLIHDVATDPDRQIFISGFVISFLLAMVIVDLTLWMPRFDFLNRIVATNSLMYGLLGLVMSVLRRPLLSREVFISEFLLSTCLLIIFYNLSHKLFPMRICVLPDTPLESFQRHPMVKAISAPLSVAVTGEFDALVTNLRKTFDSTSKNLLDTIASRRLVIFDANTIIEVLWGRIPLSNLTTEKVRSFSPPPIYKKIKRVTELLLIVASMPIALTIALITSLAIFIDSPGPILFRQKRTGFRGETFTLLKFRSMVDARQDDNIFAAKEDKRITRVGRVIRRLRLDELPQLWNVILGEMSIIGPRPEQEQFAQRYNSVIPLYAFRHNVPPGITGWAQVMHGYAASDQEAREKLEFDFYYIKNMSAWLDLVVLVKTVRTILLGSGFR